MSPTPGPWRAGKHYGAIVADHPVEGQGMDARGVEAYGGQLIAESIAPCNRPIITAAPDMLGALHGAKALLQHHGVNDTNPIFANVLAAIAKAEGIA